MFIEKQQKNFGLQKNLVKGSKIKLNDLEFKRINNKYREPLMLKEILNKKIIVNLKKDQQFVIVILIKKFLQL